MKITPVTCSFLSTKSRRPTQAFTLIELLVVIAIIAILAAILFPVFGRARENARKTSCASNLKNFSLALMQYTQDYDERTLPCGTTGTPGPDNGTFNWNLIIQPYVKNKQILRCPSSDGSYPVSYTYNRKVGQTRGISLSQIQLPSQMPAYIDCQGNSGTPAFVFTVASSYVGILGYQLVTSSETSQTVAWQPNNNALPLGGRHMEGANYSFVDGHVKWLHFEYETRGLPTARIYRETIPKRGLDLDGDGIVGPSNFPGIDVTSGTANPPGWE